MKNDVLFNFIVIIVHVCNSFDAWSKLDFLIHCKDNDAVPIHWWYLYKPLDDFFPNFWQDQGLNFTYLTPESDGRWEPAEKSIMAGSMLFHTLKPLYTPVMKNRVAYAIYEESSSSSAQGILMANEKGGVWITHTLPGFPDVTSHIPKFPQSEKFHGHLAMCLTVDLTAINKIAAAIKLASPKITTLHIPSSMADKLPKWANLQEPVDSLSPSNPILNLEVSKMESLKVLAVVRQPGQTSCLYRSFAKQRLIVLDVYGRTSNKFLASACGENYSVRNIDMISLKYPDYVYYVRKQRDLSRFAVSTAAPWQKLGSGRTQYWVCTTNLDKEDYSAKGGILVCVDNYQIWLAFRNMIVKEPECY